MNTFMYVHVHIKIYTLMFVNKRMFILEKGTFRANQQSFCFTNGRKVPN